VAASAQLVADGDQRQPLPLAGHLHERIEIARRDRPGETALLFEDGGLLPLETLERPVEAALALVGDPALLLEPLLERPQPRVARLGFLHLEQDLFVQGRPLRAAGSISWSIV